jgi:hypothetical protein
LVPEEFTQLRLGVIFGDVVHNLRCALDYIVPELARASGTLPTEQHEFPIFISREKYLAAVGDPAIGKKGRKLRGIVHGRDIIESLQPYHEQPDPKANLLWHVHSFSNADKHREITAFMPMPGAGTCSVEPWDKVIDCWSPPELPLWEPKQEFEVARFRFAVPVPTDIEAKANFTTYIRFGTGPVGQEFEGAAIDLEILAACCKHVGDIVSTFENL